MTIFDPFLTPPGGVPPPGGVILSLFWLKMAHFDPPGGGGPLADLPKTQIQIPFRGVPRPPI